MRGKISSLNVSTAAAVIFYEVVRQRAKIEVRRSRMEDRG
jgi:tRNA G18 (ribose-2'-O)-methylase SpoU